MRPLGQRTGVLFLAYEQLLTCGEPVLFRSDGVIAHVTSLSLATADRSPATDEGSWSYDQQATPNASLLSRFLDERERSLAVLGTDG